MSRGMQANRAGPTDGMGLISLPEGNGILQLNLNRPENRNSMNLQMLNELEPRLEEVALGGSVGALVLSGKERYFRAGADLRWMSKVANIGGQDFRRNLRRPEKCFVN